MKKTIIIVIIAMVLVASTVLLTACGTSMFPVNEERANKQVTATVKYADRVSIVSVEDLYNQFYSYYNYLYTYYQYGYISADQFQSYLSNLDETFETSNESLAKNALYVLKCIDFMTEYYSNPNVISQSDARVVAMKAASTKGKTYDFTKVDELNRFYSDRIAEIQTVLACFSDDEGNADYSYVNSAIRSANKDLQSRYDSYLETVKAEYAALQGTAKDTTPEGFKSISIQEKPYCLVYEVDSDATLDTRGLVVVANYAEANEEHGLTVEIPTKYLVTSGFDASKAADDQEITVTYGGKTATFTVDVVTGRPSREQAAKASDEEPEDNTKLVDKFSFEIKEEDIDKEGLTDEEFRQELKMARSAMSRLNSYLESNYQNYNSYLYTYLVNQVRELTSVVKSNAVTLDQADLDAEYARLIAERKANLVAKDFAKSDVEDVESSLLQPAYEGTYGYYYVSQVLFKFTEDLSDAISEYKNAGNANATAIRNFTINKAKEIEVWLSNPDYDAEATCELEACTCPHCSNFVLPEGAERPSFETLDDLYTCDEDCACVACPAKKYIKYNGADTGNVMDIIADIEADIDAITEMDPRAYREQLLETINAWIYKANEDSGAFSNITDKKYGYLMTPEDVSSGMVESFELACDVLAAYNGTDTYKGETFADAIIRLQDKGVFVESAEGGVGGYAWCVSDYGIHFVVLTAYAVDDDFGTVTDTTVGEEGYKQLGLDYVYSTYDYDDAQDVSLPVQQADGSTVYYAAGTIGSHIGQELLEEKISAAYAKFQKDFISENEGNISYNPKGYEYMLKKLKKNMEN